MKVYTSKSCPNCMVIKQLLAKKGVSFDEIDGTTIKSVAFLKSRKVPLQLPIIESDNQFFTFDQYKGVLK